MVEKADQGGSIDQVVIETCGKIAIAYIKRNNISQSELKPLLRDIYEAISPQKVENVANLSQVETENTYEDSITPEYIICLEDGKPYRSLKRHLKTQYNMTPEEYRRKWGLPEDYPMVAPNYSKLRSTLAKNMFGKDDAA